MARMIKRFFKGVLWLAGLSVFAFTLWLFGYSFIPIEVREVPLQFSLQKGSSLRSATRQMQTAGVLDSPWQFELLARLSGDAGRIQAGNYELTGAITPFALLRKITSGDHTQEQIVF